MRHLGTTALETDRLRLRRYRMSDAEAVFRNWATDAQAARFWTWEPHADVSETEKLLEQWIAAYDSPEYFHWVIADKQTDEAIGYIYLDDVDAKEGSASVHYLLCRRLWNRGLATEACRRVVGFALEEAGFRIIRSRHHTENPASGRVLQKCGLICIGEEYREYEKAQLCGKYRLYEIPCP